MNKLIILASVALAIVGLRAAGRRLATHQAVIPEITTRFNTRVTRINQN